MNALLCLLAAPAVLTVYVATAERVLRFTCRADRWWSAPLWMVVFIPLTLGTVVALVALGGLAFGEFRI